jgi:hypothetical protein
MRNDVVESLAIGGSIGLLALLIHAWTDAAGLERQLLALLIAGLALAALQLAWGYRRARRAGPPPEQHAQRDGHGPHNPFFRELTSDWTGLEDSPAEPPSKPQAPPPEQP